MSADSDSDLDPESNSDQDEDGEDSTPNRSRLRVSKISVLMNQIFEQIQLLYRFSVLLKRPGLSQRYLRSTNKSQVNPKFSHFSNFDYKHIREKLHQWKGKVKISTEEETAVAVEHLDERDAAELSAETEILCHRLAKANTRRREQLQYWFRHPDTSDMAQAFPESNIPLGKSSGQTSSVAAKSQTSTIKQVEQKTVTGSQALSSATSRRSFSTVAVSDLHGNQNKTRAPTIYAQSTVGNKPSNRVPNVPKTPKEGLTFKCPYCNSNLDSKELADRTSWKYVHSNVVTVLWEND